MKKRIFSRRGVALIVVLLGILVATSIVLLFFNVATNDRSATSSYASSLKADELATGGLELVIDELRKEITDPTRSTADEDPSGDGPTVYIPTQRKYIVPEQTESDAWGNLIKTSKRGKALFTGGNPLASAASTIKPSRNGRSVSLARWNKPVLAEFKSDNVAPDWIYIARQGPVVNPSLATASDPSSADFVLGRMAFNIYDTSGLLDINVAGYPDDFPAEKAGLKGSPALAKLQTLGLTDAQVKKLIAFRNPASHEKHPKEKYADYLADTEHKGFTKTLKGDNRFLTRQELINFAKREEFDDTLRFFTVFSREKNSPSIVRDTPTDANPDIATARHKATGRLLYEQRFPLSKLGIFQSPESHAEDLAKYFGLRYDQGSRSFTYIGHSGGNSKIKTLKEISNESTYRQPDFFETLKAAILEGSIGQSAGPTASITDDPDKDTHIVQIGANIIDQYDLDSDRDADEKPIPIPTTISFAGKTLYGLENLPYVNKLYVLGEPVAETGTFNAGNMRVGNENPGKNLDIYGFRMSAELWNPNFRRLPDAQSYNPKIQVSMKGEVSMSLYATSNAEPPPAGPPYGDTTPTYDAPSLKVDGQATVSVTQSSAFAYAAPNYFVEPMHVRMKPAMPEYRYDKRAQTGLSTDINVYSRWCYKSAKMKINTPLEIELAVIDQAGVPRVYQKTLPIDLPELKLSERTSPNSAAGRVGGVSSIAHSDPRTNRLGYFGVDFRVHQKTPQGPSPSGNLNAIGSLPNFPTEFISNATMPYILRPKFNKMGMSGDDNGFGIATTDAIPSSAYSPLSTGLYLGLLWENTLSTTRVQDPDGKFRLGDGGFAASASIPTPYEPIFGIASRKPWTDGVRPAGKNSSRPVILDRPFTTVADLGYVYRDVPWRSLNFSSTDSGDSALLDVFSIEDSLSSSGKVSMNTSHPEVLQSLISGSIKEEGDSSSGIKDTDALTMSQALIGASQDASKGPLQNISEVVTALSTTDIFSSANLGTSSTGEPSTAIKTQRESVIRALSGTTQTRTWNVMIDLVAQTGRFPKNATSLENDFVVEGERRYWLHVAIDRYTGEVVDEMLEVIAE